MSKANIQRVYHRLAASNFLWPREAFGYAEEAAKFLEHRLARAIGPNAIEFCAASVDEDREAGIGRYKAVIFTEHHVVRGEVQGSRKERAAYPPVGDVAIVPRSALKSLTLHHVEYSDNAPNQDYIEFSAEYEGLPTVHVGRTRSAGSESENRGRIFDACSQICSRRLEPRQCKF